MPFKLNDATNEHHYISLLHHLTTRRVVVRTSASLMTDLELKTMSIDGIFSLDRVALAFFTVVLACMQGALGMESAVACRISYKKWVLLLFLEVLITLIALLAETFSVLELIPLTRKHFQWLHWLPLSLLVIGVFEIVIDAWYTVIVGIHSRLYWIPLTFHTRRGITRKFANLLGYGHVLYVFSIVTMAVVLLIWRQFEDVGKSVDVATALRASTQSTGLSSAVMGLSAGWGLFQCSSALIIILFITFVYPRAGNIGRPFSVQRIVYQVREFLGSFNPSTFFSKYGNHYRHLARERTVEGVRAFEMLHGIQYGHVPRMNAASLGLTPLHVNNVKLGSDKNMFIKHHEFLRVIFLVQSVLRFVDGTYLLLICLVVATGGLRNQLDRYTLNTLQRLVDTVLVFVLVGLGFRLKKWLFFIGYEDDVHDKDRTVDEPRSSKNLLQKWLLNSLLMDRNNVIDPGSSIASEHSGNYGAGREPHSMEMPDEESPSMQLQIGTESLSRTRRNSYKKFRSFYLAVEAELEQFVPQLCEQDIERLDNMKLSEYLIHESTAHLPFIESTWSLSSSLGSEHAFSSFDEYVVTYPSPGLRRLVIRGLHCKNFMILIDDFFLVFDEREDVFLARVTGSQQVRIQYRDMKDNPSAFDELIGKDLSIQQVFLLVRRFIQFTGAHWDYDCLANVEMTLPGAFSLRLPETRLFSDIIIDLCPMNFGMLSSCTVGYLDIDHELFHSVGMKAFESVIAFRRTDTNIAQPIALEEGTLEISQELESHTDEYKLLIGGDNHEYVIRSSDLNRTSRVRSEERRRSPFRIQHLWKPLKACFRSDRKEPEKTASSPAHDSNLTFVARKPSELSRCTVNDRRIYNLGPVPKNEEFQKTLFEESAEDKDESVAEVAEMDPGTVIGYGATFTDVSARRVNASAVTAGEGGLLGNNLEGDTDRKAVEIETAFETGDLQFKRYVLQRAIRKKKGQFTLEDMTQDFLKLGYGEKLATLIRYCAREKWNWKERPSISLIEAQYLLLNAWDGITHQSMVPHTMSGRPYIRRGEHFLVINSGKLVMAHSTKTITHSFTIGIGASVEGVGPRLGYSRASKKEDIICRSDVWSVLDAIELVTGDRLRDLKKFRDGHACFLTPLQMEEFLGPLLFVLFLIGDKYKAAGRFKKCLVDNESSTKPEVRFDVPIPCGVLCSTLARARENDEKWMLVDGDWDFDRDFEHLVLYGVDRGDSELRKLVEEHRK